MKSIITYTAALDYVLTNYPVPENIAERLTALKASVEKRNASHGSDEAKAKQAEKRKADTAAKRAELVAKVAPAIRKVMSKTPMTEKEIFEAAKAELPADFSAIKVRNVLLREMASEIVKDDNGKNPNTYHL
jgi:hypothetical protein